MTIQHRDIPDAQLHEPKGVATAASDTIYVANGAGSGTWKKIDSTELLGLSGDGGLAEQKLVTNGANGFTMRRDTAYGVMAITNNGNNFAVTAAVDPTLVSNADYVLFTGTGAPWAGETLYGMTFLTDRLIVPVNGVYSAKCWANVTAFPTNTARIGAKFRINGTTFSPRTTIVKSNSVGDYGLVSAFGYATLNANDFVQLYVASTDTGNLRVQNLNFTLELIRAT